MRELLRGEAEELFGALSLPPDLGLRVNTFRGNVASVAGALPWSLTPVPWCGAGFTVSGGEARQGELAPGVHPYQDAGVYYLQDPSAMAVAEALAPQPGELVLDLAAAPGGKSTHIAALMSGEGWLVANDVSGVRARALASNLERCGVWNATVTSEEPSRLAAALGAAFDRVLLDAPCSGEGMFRKSVAALSQWSEGEVGRSAALQERLLSAASSLVKPGGYLAYSTCTFAPEENERVIARFVRATGYELVPLDLPGASRGRPEWVAASERVPGLSGTLRFWPHLSQGEGHFVALMRRPPSAAEELRGERGGFGAAARGAAGRRARGGGRRGAADAGLTAQLLSAWREFAGELLSSGAPFAPTELQGGWLVQGRGAGFPPATLPALRHGLQLAEVRRARGGVRLVPAHALAMALPAGAARQRLELEPGGPLVSAYLAGEEVASKGADGYLRVEVSGFPLGWGRRSGDRVRSLLPRGLRRR